MDDDDQERCRLSINAHIEAIAARHGAHLADFHGTVVPSQDAVDAPVGYSVRVDDRSGAPASVKVEWTPHRSNGSRREWSMSRKALAAGGFPGAEFTKALERKIRDIARLQRRETIVMRVNGGREYPAWSFSVNALIASLLEHYDYDLTEIVRNRNPHLGRDAWPIGRCDGGIVSTPGSMDDGITRRSKIALTSTRMLGSRLVFGEVVIEEMSIALVERPDEVILYLHDTQVSDTIRTSVRGRNVAEIIGHPAFRMSDEVQVIGFEDRADGRAPGLRLRQRRRPLAAAPAGIETDWLKDR